MQLQRVENGLLHAVSAMGDEELLVLTKLLIEIEHFELVSLGMFLLVSCFFCVVWQRHVCLYLLSCRTNRALCRLGFDEWSLRMRSWRR